MNAPAVLAYEHNGGRVSRERFYAIACDPRRSVAVEACAGAGKTWMLVSRILRALLAGAKPHEILAITFTKKAAGEMRQRLHDWLAAFAHASAEDLVRELVMRGITDPTGAQVEALKGLYAGVLASGRPVQIRTFHSWFAALLRNAPLAVLEELRLPAHYELLEDDSEAIDMVWRRFHAVVAAQPAARVDFEASVAAHGRFQTQKALLAALAKRVEFALADTHGVIEGSIKPFGEQFPEFGGLGEPCDALTRLAGVQAQLADAARSLGAASAPTFSAKGVQLEMALAAGDLQSAFDALLTQKGEPRKFSEKLQGLDHVRAAQELVLRLSAACAQHDAWLHHHRMARLARILIEQFADLKRERGWVDMNDVERAAQFMLADPVLSGWVQERLDARVKHLLIDEFQDTNPLQWQALNAWLSGYAGAGGDAPGVFVVGDPKQSIYRFRRAEPQVFRAAQQFVVEGLGGDLLSCDHTHRNAPRVIDVVNQVMSAAQEAAQYEGFRPHTTQSAEVGAVASLPPIERMARAVPNGGSEDEPLSWRDSLTVPRELPEEKLVALECRQAAAWVASELQAGREPRDIMVLARKRDRLAAMEDELRALHIPAQQPEKTDLCEAPEVQDIVALLDVLVSPTHDLSLARALKSPLFGLGDEVLVGLAVLAREARDGKRPTSWFELVQQKPDLAPGLADAAAKLAKWKKLLDRLPPHDVLDAIFHEGEVLARYAAAAPAPLRGTVLSRLRALLGAALQVDGARYSTPYGFVRALKAGGIQAPALSEAQAVRLLTVHGAKGLEAPVVLMLDTDGAPARAETMGVVVEWPGEAPAPWRFAFIASETRPPPCSAEALEVEKTARQREELNALYVAMTRARYCLVISSVQPYIASEMSWWQRLLPFAATLGAAPPVSQAGPLAQRVGERFLLPELPVLNQKPPPAALKPPGMQGAPDTDETRFGKALHRLLERWATGAVTPAAIRRVAREFALDESVAAQAAAMAQRIRAGEGAWAWDRSAIDWQANEVPLHHEGELLRIDRLVRRAGSGEWWVLDYKSNSRPQADAILVDKMNLYRTAVAKAYPGAVVKAAFLTGEGRMVAVE
ncbi:exodeoxyribonuclease V subunit beta [Ramlibacter sp. WS9]|uniref:UvrD-helicase domain-containing protein n=1 Tax=Ramlibacter sp. WS9 TaxID=1882741 RepID=UPI0011420D48|nr:UvrD-helicase domain-containing protein [Ramlibacter sp. WS9]ROZ77170.1 DNA helicase UvrD [Ramlibacter sp. WS9]